MSSFQLKIVAMVSMLIDHTLHRFDLYAALMKYTPLDAAMAEQISHWVRATGRIAFPIFAFLIAEGCRHTRDARKYILRLLLFGVISEVPFQLSLMGRSPATLSFGLHNVFFTLALGAMACVCFRELRGKGVGYLLSLLPAVGCMALATLLETDYQFWGALLIFAAFALPNRPAQVIGMAVILSALYLFGYTPNILQATAGVMRQHLLRWGFALVAVMLIALYNGTRGRKAKCLFYAFYPAHLLLLLLV